MNSDTMIRIFLLVVGNTLALLLALSALQTTAGNALGWVLFVVAIVYMAGGVFVLWLDYDKEAPRNSWIGHRSFWWTILGFAAALFGPLLEYRHLPPFLPRSPEMQIAGLGLVVLGLTFRGWAYLAERRTRSGRAPSRPGLAMVVEGPYRLARHPGWLGLLLVALGMSIGYSSVIGLVAALLLLMPGLAWRIHAEEKLRLQVFGEEYRSYCRRTKRLVPGIW